MVTDDIRALLTDAYPAASQPFLERVDTVLTDGYARALELEAVRWRIERDISEALVTLPDQPDLDENSELVLLAKRLRCVNEKLATLRPLLKALREKRAEVRAA
jgi:hypothetical protein